MSTISIISLVTAGVMLLINVYVLGERQGYEKGFNDGRFKANLEDIPKRIFRYTNKEDEK